MHYVHIFWYFFGSLIWFILFFIALLKRSIDKGDNYMLYTIIFQIFFSFCIPIAVSSYLSRNFRVSRRRYMAAPVLSLLGLFLPFLYMSIACSIGRVNPFSSAYLFLMITFFTLIAYIILLNTYFLYSIIRRLRSIE